MKYLIHNVDFLDELVAEGLIKELKRYDIRAEIIKSSQRVETRHSILNDNADIILIIGSKLDKQLIKAARKSKSKVSYLIQSSKATNRPNLNNEGGIGLKLIDLPNTRSKFNYLGNPILEVIKTLSEENQAESTVPNVAFLTGKGSSRKRISVGDNLKAAFSNFQVSQIKMDQNLQGAVHAVKRANATIVTDSIGELIALQLNCPAIRISGQSIFRKIKPSLINEIAKREVIKVFSKQKKKEMGQELSLIMNDHQYCATILENYQKIKGQILGLEPASRKIAQCIIDWLEEEEN